MIITSALVIEEGWKNDQIPKWNNDPKFNPTFIQYASFVNEDKIKDIDFDSVLWDEGHHITERCRDIIFKYRNKFNNIPMVILSATVNKEKMDILKSIFVYIHTVKVSMSQAVEADRLPSPKIIFVKCKLNSSDTATYMELNKQFEYYKAGSKTNQFMMTKMKRLAKDIYEWLSDKKVPITKMLLYLYKDYGKLTFCSNIEQCEELGLYPVHSKNKKSKELIDKFNKGKIKNLTSCRVLLEGVNLKGCKIGIFNYLSPTLRIQVQSCGRILRHKEPVLIFTYYEGTKEEKIVNNIYEQYKDVSEVIITNEDKIKEAYELRKSRRKRKKDNAG